MKRAEALIGLSREHHQSLRLAKQCLNTAASGDQQAIADLCRHIADGFEQEWERHFRQEEISIFSVTRQNEGEAKKLGIRLKNEHDRMREIAATFKQGDCRLLREFGELLKEHTRLEERQLFPLIEKTFDADQLAFIKANDANH